MRDRIKKGRVTMRARGPLAAAVATTLMIGLATALQPTATATADAAWPARKPAPPTLVEGHSVPVLPLPSDAAVHAATQHTAAPSWPSGGATNLSLAGSAARTTIGTLPIVIGPPSARIAAGSDAPPAAVRVEVIDHATAMKRGVAGLLVRLHRTDGLAPAGSVSLSVDYSAFRYAYGGDWASRLRFVALPDTGGATALPTRNDVKSGVATADVSVAKADMTYALEAGANGESGDYSATSLAPSGTWSVSTQSGDFDWSYPLRVPTVPGDLEPPLALSYSSGAVDGRTAATNNQTSAVGEGWGMWPGFIERGYKSCYDVIPDQASKTGDECWGGENATMSFAGHSSQLVFAGGNTWRPKNDDGSRVEHLVGGSVSNGDNDNEWWKVTTTDGTQYLFGRSTASTWTVPVYGYAASDPCHASTYCTQAYRWNLDSVVDPHGNTIKYSYVPETNNYSRGIDTSHPTGYTRGGYLDSIDYGGRGTEHPMAKVVLTNVERGGPDVPSDLACANGANCGAHFSPTFWSTKRLSTIKTQVWNGTRYLDVDQWTLAHSYPANQDGTTASLWLDSITHTGLAIASSVSVPRVTFAGTQLPNRVNSDTDGVLPMDKWRVGAINTESGGTISVHYQGGNCLPSALPTPQSNTQRCFPVTWTPKGGLERHDWMNKYVIDTVAQQDRVSGQPTEVTNYDYDASGMAWHYDDNPLLPVNRRTWSQYRGYQKVLVRHGDPSKGAQSATRYVYFRGMNGDHLPTGTRSASVTDSRNVVMTDSDQLAGFEREELTYNGVNGPVLTSVINDPWQRGPGATQGALKSYVIKTAKTLTRDALSSGGWRSTEVDSDFNDQGLEISANDLGDIATSADDQCTTTKYARNDALWLIDRPSEVKIDGVACAAARTYPRDAISDERSYYDGGVLGVAPVTGNVTKTDEVDAYTGAVASFVKTATATFDAYGRTLTSVDALNRQTATTYAPTTGLPTTVKTTDALGDVTTSTMDLQLAQPTLVTDANGQTTTLEYDALGRQTAVYLPGRKVSDGPSTRYAYGVRSDGPSWVSTESLKANNNYLTSYTLYDGFLRPRQTQALGSGAAGSPPVRVLSDTLYDSRGLTFQVNGPYADNGTPGTALVGVSDNQVPSLTRTDFDGAERPTGTTLQSLGVVKSRTTTAYFGDHTELTPETGGTPTTTYTDARDQVSQLWQHHAATPTGAHDVTGYKYTHAGQLDTLTDAAGNVWRYTYDLHGRQTHVSDPDKGESSTTYDAAGQVVTSTDGRGITLAYKYDALGRKTEEHKDSLAGPLLASWSYDPTLSGVKVKGQLGSSTRFVGADAYTTKITGYDAAYRQTGKRLTIPASQTPLHGDYDTTMTYKADGSPATVRSPALPGIGAETLTYSYDSLGQQYAMAGASEYVHDAAYSEFGELSQVQLGSSPKQVSDTYYFDMATRRTTRSVVDRQGMTGSVADLNYSYDPAGNVTRIGDAAAGSAADNQCFGYDPLRRLTDAWTTTATTCAAAGSSFGGPAPYWTSFTYDAVGNRLTEDTHGTGLAQAVRAYTYPAAGRARPHAITSIGAPGARAAASTYQYDAAGNMISRPGQTMTWTPASQLATVTAGTNTTTDSYDADGALVAAKDSLGSTVYLDGAEMHYTKATGQATSTRYYTFGGGTVAVRTGGGVSWVSHDNHGTDNVSIDSATLAATGRRTDPFGNPRGAAPSTWPSKRGFVGGIDQGTGLIHLGAREYDADTGAFLSVDPLLDPQDPQQLNAYAYSNNNPTTMSDPNGMRVFEGDSGGWQDSHAAPRPKHHSAPPSYKPTSHAYRNDFGGRCQHGDPCGAIARIAALHPFHYEQGPGRQGPYVNEADRPHGPGRIVWDIPRWAIPMPVAPPTRGPITNRNGSRDDCHENRQAHVVCWYDGIDGPTAVSGPLTGNEDPTDRKRRLDDEAAHPIEQRASTQSGSAAMCSSAGGQLIIAVSFETCDDGSSGWSVGIGLGAGVSVSSGPKVQTDDGCKHGTETYIQSGIATPWGGYDAQVSATPGLEHVSGSFGPSYGFGGSLVTVGKTGSFC